MVTWQDFTIESVQVSVFTPEPNSFVTGKAVGAILSHFQGRFNGEMQVLPLPDDFPHQFPRVQLQSSDHLWQLAMGPARVDAIWSNVPAAETATLENLVADCAKAPQQYVESMCVSVARLALVVKRFCTAPDPANTLIERFCDARSRQEPFNRSTAFEIHNHKVYRPRKAEIDYSINSWVRCKSALLLADKRPAIAVEQDLNTLIEDVDRRFDIAAIGRFCDMAAFEADQIIQKYFPVQQ